MKRFKNILFYTDCQAGSRFALHRAWELARRNQVQRVACAVLTVKPAGFVSPVILD